MLETTQLNAVQTKVIFNLNKLQAVACMAASAAVSIGVIIWIAKAFS